MGTREREIQGLDLRYGRLRSRMKVRIPDEFPSADGLIVIDLEDIDRDEAFEKEEREQDFFFLVNAVMQNEFIYRIPEGFEVFYVSPDLNMERPEMSFARTFTRTPLGVTVKETMRLKRLRLKKEAIGEIRTFRADLARQSKQRMVFKRKTKPHE